MTGPSPFFWLNFLRGKTGMTEILPRYGHSWLVIGTTQAVQTEAVFFHPAHSFSMGIQLFSLQPQDTAKSGRELCMRVPGELQHWPCSITTTAETQSKLNRGFSKQQTGQAAAPIEQAGLYANICTSAPIAP